MRFGKTLRESVYSPWKGKYIDYAKLKSLLREDRYEDDDVPWTEDDENRFCDALLNVELEKVAQFQEDTFNSIRNRVDSTFDKLKELAPTDGQTKSDITVARLKEIDAELESITNEVRELKKYSSINYTGFLKIVKKHDRKRGDRYRVRPMMQLTLAQRPFNSEQGYSPIINKLSLMYFIIQENLNPDESIPRADLEAPGEVLNGERYVSHRFWVHPDNLLEVKTNILRRLPALVYSNLSSQGTDAIDDPTITCIYFDNSKFDLYTKKVERKASASSLRIRWTGQLSARPELFLEQKTVDGNGDSVVRRLPIKDKYVKAFIDGDYKMEKTIQKMERQGQSAEEVAVVREAAAELQQFVLDNKISPVLRANFTRTAFQRPLDDRVRISIDTDVAFIREDTLDRDRPCRDPQEWHRTDIDDSKMEYPFRNINQSEVTRFPYALLEIKIRENGARKQPAWIGDLMASHLVHPAPRFSKFVHGVASLFEDYVNNYPFWLSDLQRDIRKDPQKAFDEEEQRKLQQAVDEQVVGSFLGTKTSSFRPTRSSPVTQSFLANKMVQETQASAQTPAAASAQAAADAARESSQGKMPGYGTWSSVMPNFSMSRYALAKRQKDQAEPLPEGVVEPTEWIKNTGELKIEPKVWLANERTFLKWQHICILLGSLSIALYTAAGQDFLGQVMGIVYIAIATFAGLWGYMMMRTRRAMIVERSGKDFDNMVGPLVVSAALMGALLINFFFQWKAAFGRLDQPAANVSIEAVQIVGELV